MAEHKSLTFSIEGKIITDVAREHFYVRNDMAKALDLLCAGLQSDQLNEYERMALALRVLDGKAEIRGTYPGDSYGLYDLDEPDCRFSIADHIGKLAKKLETAESELHDLQVKFSLVAEGLSDTQKREANSAWFSLDYDHRRPIFDDVEPVPLIPGLTSQLDSFLERMTGPETTTDDYGWLEPSGKFHEVPFGEHQGWAWKKALELGFSGEAFDRGLGGDVLLEHGWVLLDNPGLGLARPTSSDTRPMTKAQREVLFDYYTERNRPDLAKKYLEDD